MDHRHARKRCETKPTRRSASPPANGASPNIVQKRHKHVPSQLNSPCDVRVAILPNVSGATVECLIASPLGPTERADLVHEAIARTVAESIASAATDSTGANEVQAQALASLLRSVAPIGMYARRMCPGDKTAGWFVVVAFGDHPDIDTINQDEGIMLDSWFPRVSTAVARLLPQTSWHTRLAELVAAGRFDLFLDLGTARSRLPPRRRTFAAAAVSVDANSTVACSRLMLATAADATAIVVARM